MATTRTPALRLRPRIAMYAMLVQNLVYVLWLTRCVSSTVRRFLSAPMNALAAPLEGLPTFVEQLCVDDDDDHRYLVVLNLRNPARMLFGRLRSTARRRSWLVQRLQRLPKRDDIVYVMHFFDRAGGTRRVLTADPARGVLGPPAAALKVVSAYLGPCNVTAHINDVAGSFQAGETPPGDRELFVYLFNRIGFSTEDAAGLALTGGEAAVLSVIDSRLNERLFRYDRPSGTAPSTSS